MGIVTTLNSSASTQEDLQDYNPQSSQDIDSYMPEIRQLFAANEICYHNALYIVIFGTIAIAMIVCTLTARRRRVSSLIIGLVLLLTYFAIGFGFFDPHWSDGGLSAPILTTYSFFNMDMFVRGDLRIGIGLSYFNVSYTTVGHSVSSQGKRSVLKVAFEERFEFAHDPWDINYDQLQDAKLDALMRGLPSPIISIAEYLATNGHGFSWGPMFTAAGDGAKVTLEFALASTIITTVLIIVVPSHGICLFPLSGVLMVISCIVYWSYSPDPKHLVFVEGIAIPIDFGRTIFLVFFVGIFDIILGFLSIILLNLKLLGTFSTYMELHYDTPWSDQVIVTDMKNRHAIAQSTQSIRKSIRRLKSAFKTSSPCKLDDPPPYNVENGKGSSLSSGGKHQLQRGSFSDIFIPKWFENCPNFAVVSSREDSIFDISTNLIVRESVRRSRSVSFGIKKSSESEFLNSKGESCSTRRFRSLSCQRQRSLLCRDFASDHKLKESDFYPHNDIVAQNSKTANEANSTNLCVPRFENISPDFQNTNEVALI